MSYLHTSYSENVLLPWTWRNCSFNLYNTVESLGLSWFRVGPIWYVLRWGKVVGTKSQYDKVGITRSQEDNVCIARSNGHIAGIIRSNAHIGGRVYMVEMTRSKHHKIKGSQGWHHTSNGHKVIGSQGWHHIVKWSHGCPWKITRLPSQGHTISRLASY